MFRIIKDSSREGLLGNFILYISRYANHCIELNTFEY